MTTEAPIEAAVDTKKSKSRERAPLTRADREKREDALIKANDRARKEFVNRYEGTAVSMAINLGNRPVVRQFRKSFDICMRDWHTATSVPRSALGDTALANAAEQRMMLRTTESLNWMKLKIRELEALATTDPDVDFSKAVHANPTCETVKIIGPVGMNLFNLYKHADKLCDYAQVAHIFGVMSSDEHSKLMYEVKERMQRVAAVIRNQRIEVLQRVNELGKNRPNFKSVDPHDEADAHMEADEADAAAPEALEPVAQAA